MSVVVWDGKTLAADCQATNCDLRFKAHKIFMRETSIGKTIAALTGDLDSGMLLIDWFFDGAKKEDFPKIQEDKDRWCRLIVADKDGCRFYERTPCPMPVLAPFMAWGSGRDFALGALAMGADARKAVEVACQFSTGCGMGVEAFDAPKAKKKIIGLKHPSPADYPNDKDFKKAVREFHKKAAEIAHRKANKKRVK